MRPLIDSAEFRHWMMVHGLQKDFDLTACQIRDLRTAIQETLPRMERQYWRSVCDNYDGGDWPKWFVEEVAAQ